MEKAEAWRIYRENLWKYWKLRTEFSELFAWITWEAQRLADSHWIKYDRAKTKVPVLMKQLIRSTSFAVKYHVEPVLNQESHYIWDKSVSRTAFLLGKLAEINEFLKELWMKEVEISDEAKTRLRELRNLIECNVL